MRPDDRFPTDDMMHTGMELPFDADLEALDAELDAAGVNARRSLHGRSQPTRVYSANLRASLVAGLAEPAFADGPGPDAALPRGHERGSRVRPELVTAGETWAPTPLAPQIARRTPTVLPRARWSMLAAAMLTLVVVAGSLGAGLDWLLPSPTADPSAPPASAAPQSDGPATPGPTPDGTAAAILPDPSPATTTGPDPDPTKAADPTSTPRPAPTRTPKPTAKPKPDPTKPPVGPMDLAVKACPGGVVLDWTKPSTAVAHYHVLRSLGGDVPPTYPADGTTEIETATTFGAGVTDGFDATLGGGKTATYRAFAFDDEDQVLAFSPSRTVTTLGRLDLGSLGIVEHEPGSITVSWGAASVSDGCFTYGKLVASVEDPDPSYLKGSPYLAVIEDSGATNVVLDGLPSGKTVWMRYEMVRVTSTGKFIVASSDVRQVTFP